MRTAWNEHTVITDIAPVRYLIGSTSERNELLFPRKYHHIINSSRAPVTNETNTDLCALSCLLKKKGFLLRLQKNLNKNRLTRSTNKIKYYSNA